MVQQPGISAFGSLLIGLWIRGDYQEIKHIYRLLGLGAQFNGTSGGGASCRPLSLNEWPCFNGNIGSLAIGSIGIGIEAGDDLLLTGGFHN